VKPTPYYDQNGITIYHGDCAQILPFLDPVDLLLTDPPYGIGEHGGKCRTRGQPGKVKHVNMGWDRDIPPRFIFDQMLALASVHIIWGGNYFTECLPPSMGWLYWRKLMGGDFSDGELAWTSRPVALKEFTKCPKVMGRVHPCQKPVELMNWCLSLAGDNAHTVLDPFMGSGTTLVAAKNKGKRCIGIEREEAYCKMAVQRLNQQSLFQIEDPK